MVFAPIAQKSCTKNHLNEIIEGIAIRQSTRKFINNSKETREFKRSGHPSVISHSKNLQLIKVKKYAILLLIIVDIYWRHFTRFKISNCLSAD